MELYSHEIMGSWTILEFLYTKYSDIIRKYTWECFFLQKNTQLG